MTKTLKLNHATLTLNEYGEYQGKVTIWGKEAELFIDTKLEEESIILLANEKLDWVIENRSKILACFLEETAHYIDVINDAILRGEFESDNPITENDFLDATFINNLWLSLFDEKASITIDLEQEPDYLYGHLACIEVEHDYSLLFGGING